MCVVCAARAIGENSVTTEQSDAQPEAILNSGMLAYVDEGSDASPDSSTTSVVPVGDFFNGSISAGDRDFIAVDLTAGQTYTIAMVGTGALSSGLTDPFLSVFREDGTTLVASDDDGGPGRMSSMTFSAPVTGRYFIEARSFSSTDTGNYTVSVAEGSRAQFDHQMAAGSLIRSESSWSSNPETAATLSYAFRGTGPASDADGNSAPFSQLTAAQEAAAEDALAVFSEVSGLTFNRVNSGGTSENATILFGGYSSNDDGAGAYAYFPGSSSSASVAGDVWLNNNSVSGSNLSVGTYSYFTMLHELGHALGLSHPGDYNAAAGQSITYANNAQYAQDSHQYTVMSYFDESNTTSSFGAYPQTLMLHDIYALHQLYGANMSTRATDTVYGFNSNAGGVYDFATNSSPVISIWDGGGIDTIDLSGFSQDQLISLIGGSFSNVGALSNNVSIAFGAVIENAMGGNGNDEIIGNDANNTLNGNGGNDTINGGNGNDTVIVTHNDGNDAYTGGSGFDVLDFSAVQGVVQINQLGGTVTGSAGNDTLNDVFEQIIGSNFNDVLSGGNGGDVLDGNGGNDQFFANGGDDLIRGGEGNDTFYFAPNDGNDRLEGGAGFDILDYSSLGGVVQINQLAGTTTGTANNDILLDVFEQVIGTNFGDVISGGHGINSLSGGGGDDQIFANNGDDYTSGGDGNDTITMGLGNDTHDFRNGEDIDTITDFTAGAGTEDTITLRYHSAATSFAQMQSAGMFSQQGADTHIDLGGGDIVILQNIMVSALHQDDFVF